MKESCVPHQQCKGLIHNHKPEHQVSQTCGDLIIMPVKLKSVVIDSIDEAETKRLKLIKMSSKADGATVTLELPEALCETMKVKDTVDIVIDANPILKGDAARLYVEGTIFKSNMDDDLDVVGTIGGLKLTLKIGKPKPAQKKTFETEKFFLMLN